MSSVQPNHEQDNIYSDEGLSPVLQLARHQHPKFGQIMAEYSVAAVINIERNMDTIKRNQMAKIWCKRYNSTRAQQPIFQAKCVWSMYFFIFYLHSFQHFISLLCSVELWATDV